MKSGGLTWPPSPRPRSARSADVIVVGAGLAGLVAAAEAADAGCRVLLLDQEGEVSLGGQAFWSLGGLFMVNTPEQRRLGIRDSHELAMRDWMATAGFDREDDRWPRQWAEASVDFAAGEMRPWLHAQGSAGFRRWAGPNGPPKAGRRQQPSRGFTSRGVPVRSPRTRSRGGCGRIMPPAIAVSIPPSRVRTRDHERRRARRPRSGSRAIGCGAR